MPYKHAQQRRRRRRRRHRTTCARFSSSYQEDAHASSPSPSPFPCHTCWQHTPPAPRPPAGPLDVCVAANMLVVSPLGVAEKCGDMCYSYICYRSPTAAPPGRSCGPLHSCSIETNAQGVRTCILGQPRQKGVRRAAKL